MDSEEEEEGGEETTPELPRRGRPRREAAERARTRIAEAAVIVERREPKKRRPVVTVEEWENGFMESEIAEVEKVVARKKENGKTYYLVKWLASDEGGEPEMDWSG